MDKILVVQTAFLGDVILVTPLVRALRELYPEAAIDVLVRPQNAPALLHNPHIRRALFFDKNRAKWPEFFRLLRQIRRERYSAAISPHSSFTTALLLRFSGIGRRVGFDRYLARHLLTDRVQHKRGVHKTQKILELLKAFNPREFSHQTEIFTIEVEEARAAVLIESENTIAISPGSVWPTKRWPRDYYVKLTHALAGTGYNLVFIGGGDEQALCADIIHSAEVVALNLAGELSVTESAACLRRCRLLVCNDSGALHIANAVQTPVYAFFGPTVTRFGYYPFREGDRVFQVELPCRPCGGHGSKVCPLRHHDCMMKILPEQVYAEIVKQFPAIPSDPQEART